MEIEEKSNLLIIYLNRDEDLFAQLNDVIRIYRLLTVKISGFGYLKRLEYGLLSKIDPLFLNKFLIEDLITVTSLSGMIYNKDINLMITSVDKDNNKHIGRFISGVVAESFTIFLEVMKTE
ncbi:PCC domain-containing protein [Spiroplasma turonicum]|uniref:Uncharacterized protein n=1 Tax=Spiroplasma turonicum TaxID=216946 RepID=A0A0K1P6T9_9MOLU|nr:DUF296 domain-containing protein [Spiroplasma turonicum]AKU79597.1 hypothetical protein STURON_00351 [Spiroplasma turonicum]ALX70619.1 hypothetical protein STURO_v1c03510 [Spiroplasma turonicum]